MHKTNASGTANQDIFHIILYLQAVEPTAEIDRYPFARSAPDPVKLLILASLTDVG